MVLKNCWKFESFVLMFLVFLISFSVLSADVKAEEPQFISFSFETDADTMNMNWESEFDEGTGELTIECTLNDNPASECTYTGYPGGGSCSINSPVYDTSQDGSLPRTVQNKLNCTVYDTDDPTLFTEKVVNFYPVAFEISMPSQMGMVVGEIESLVITVKNIGTMDDSYDIIVTATSPEVMNIGNGVQTTGVLSTNDAQQIYVNVMLLTSEGTATVNVVVSSVSYSGIQSNPSGAELTIIGGYKSLPDFGILGVFQIMFFAAILISFLF